MAVRKVGNARIVRELGRGAMGIVYEGYQDDLERSVAIKELPPSAARNKELAQRFRREGVAYGRMRHESLIQVYDFVEKSDAYYLITEFVDGADLSRVLAKGGPMEPGVVAAIGARIAHGLAHAHELKLLHRDIKPANVLMSCWGEVKVTDFGIVKDLQASDLTREGMVVGSLPFMAPEVLSSGDYNVRTDIWALGVTLYELAAGVRPFTGKDDGTLMRAILKGDHAHVRQLSPAMPRRLGRAIERCLARKPGKRWQHAILLARELEACADDIIGLPNLHDALTIVMHERGFRPQGEGYDGQPATTIDEVQETKAPPRARAADNDTKWVAMALMAAASVAAGFGWYFLH